MTISELTSFFGWCSVISSLVLCISSLLIFTFRAGISNIHSKLSGVEKAALPEIYFNYLAQLKLLVIIFNLVPYFSLVIIS